MLLYFLLLFTAIMRANRAHLSLEYDSGFYEDSDFSNAPEPNILALHIPNLDIDSPTEEPEKDEASNEDTKKFYMALHRWEQRQREEMNRENKRAQFDKEKSSSINDNEHVLVSVVGDTEKPKVDEEPAFLARLVWYLIGTVLILFLLLIFVTCNLYDISKYFNAVIDNV